MRGGPQRIPRPEAYRLGPGARWAQPGTAPEVVTVELVRQAFEGTRPFEDPVGGEVVVDRRMLGTAPIAERERENRPAAVLCALFDDGGQARVVLTRRSAHLRSHTGEVSLPGGRLEAGETPLVAALREAHEEVGLDPGLVEVVGRLSLLSTRRNPSAITPFVGLLAAPPVLRPNAEVERVFTVPLVELFHPDCYHEELWQGPDGAERSVSFFDVVGDTVWGATGRMLAELLDRVWILGPGGGEGAGGAGGGPGGAAGAGGGGEGVAGAGEGPGGAVEAGGPRNPTPAQ